MDNDRPVLTLTPGDRLANGATVLSHRDDTVLALWGREFVTWRVNALGETYLGHYFQTVTEALDDFRERIA